LKKDKKVNYKKQIPILIYLMMAVVSYASSNRIPIPNKPAEINEAYVVKDPSTGDKVVCDQLILAFKEEVNRPVQEKILGSIQGKVVGGIPAMAVYQVAFKNPELSLTKMKSIRDQLSKNENILFVVPRKVALSKGLKIDYRKSFASTSRKGSLSLSNTNHPKRATKRPSIQNTIRSHYQGLSACVERKSRLYERIHGQITFRIDISAQGHVLRATVVESSIKDKTLLTCLIRKVRNWKDFPKNSLGQKVRVDFDFIF
jgi:hypothetical protein